MMIAALAKVMVGSGTCEGVEGKWATDAEDSHTCFVGSHTTCSKLAGLLLHAEFEIVKI